MKYVILEDEFDKAKPYVRSRRGKLEKVSGYASRHGGYEKIEYRSFGEGPEVHGWVVEGKKDGKWHAIAEFGPHEERKAELEQERLSKASAVVYPESVVEKAERGHKAYSRSVKGKQQQIKQKGAAKLEEKGKKKDKKEEGPKKSPSGVEVGHVILIGEGHEAKVVAVGKDGVTAKDDKGNKHLITHDNVEKKGGKKSEKDKDDKVDKVEKEKPDKEGGEKKESDSFGQVDSKISELETKYKTLKDSGKLGSKILSDVKSVIDQWKEEEAKKRRRRQVRRKV